jgi:hypothetical protein
MLTTRRLFSLGALGLFAFALPASAVVIDGTADGDYGSALSVQITETGFGDSDLGLPDFANGSELDQGFGTIRDGSLFLLLAGNLESNFNKLDPFIDSGPGGQNTLRGDNANVDFDGLNRMGDDGSGNGLTFDTGFESDYWFSCTGGNMPYQLFANFAETLTGGGGSGGYLGETTAQSDGTLSGGTNPNGIKVTIDNSNTGGVDGGCDASSGAGVTTGIEIEIPLAAIGNPTGCVRVSAFVNGSGHDFLSNQVLGPVPVGTCNLGEPRLVNFNQYPGDQHFTVCESTVAVEEQLWGQVKNLYR